MIEPIFEKVAKEFISESPILQPSTNDKLEVDMDFFNCIKLQNYKVDH
jgi:hypothetical protein